MLEIGARKALSQSEFALLGLDQVVYIRPVTLSDGKHVIGVFAADGRPLAGAPDVEAARALVRQNDMELARLH